MSGESRRLSERLPPGLVVSSYFCVMIPSDFLKPCMTEKADVSPSSQPPRHCPVCGIRVAAKASECLMCGASLTEEQLAEPEDELRRELPGWVGSVIVAVLALAILTGGAYGLYLMLSGRAEAEPTGVPVTASPTATLRPTVTPTDTPVPTSTPTPLPPRPHEVQTGETLSDIAQRYDVTVDEIVGLNPEVDPELIRAGQVLMVPRLRAGVENTDSGDSGEGDSLVHVVESGETLSSVAAQYGIPVSLLRAANDLSGEDETIRSGQSLIVPIGTPTPGAGAANLGAASAAPATYAPPPLLYPADGMVLEDDGPVVVQWASVSVLRSNEWYELRLWQSSGGVFSTTVRTRATAWRLPLDALEDAGATAGEFRWRVQVVRDVTEQVYETAGAPSDTHSFRWPGLTSTPTPSPTSSS